MPHTICTKMYCTWWIQFPSYTHLADRTGKVSWEMVAIPEMPSAANSYKPSRTWWPGGANHLFQFYYSVVLLGFWLSLVWQFGQIGYKCWQPLLQVCSILWITVYCQLRSVVQLGLPTRSKGSLKRLYDAHYFCLWWDAPAKKVETPLLGLCYSQLPSWTSRPATFP